MFEFEVIVAVRDFIERGGDVLFAIAAATAFMWALIYERVWYFWFGYKSEVKRVRDAWEERVDHSSWRAHQIRRMLVSRASLMLDRRLWPIETIVKLCPMLGLLGTVTGMIEVFDVMALAGSGNARGMAAGVSKATLPTMAGMVAALSGMLFSIQLRRFAREESQRIEDSLHLEMGEE